MSLYSVLESNLNHGYSVASQDVLAFATQASDSLNSASSAISLLLTNIYGFSQQTVDVLLSSPPLTALPLINPALLVLVLVAGADPVKMVENYPAWESQLASRRSAFEGNIGSVYTFISTGLPRAESLVLAGLSQLATIGNAVVNKRVAQNTENGGYQHDFNYVRTSVEPRYIDYAAPSMAAPTSTMLF
ncbi:hypothetical protein GGI07_002261 [Coemansia sp. Benny D115]|nr:hypothetical protein GGI07_002261 [Coemansia sp. Benny D115]